MSAAGDRDWAAASVARLEKNVAAAVARLRDSADRIERDARRAVEAAKLGNGATYGAVAREVVHEIVWGAVANANLSNIIDAASDADLVTADQFAKKIIDQEDETVAGVIAGLRKLAAIEDPDPDATRAWAIEQADKLESRKS